MTDTKADRELLKAIIRRNDPGRDFDALLGIVRRALAASVEEGSHMIDTKTARERLSAIECAARLTFGGNTIYDESMIIAHRSLDALDACRAELASPAPVADEKGVKG